MSKRGVWVSLGLAGAILLSGCARSPDPDAVLAQLKAERWCYRTLAQADCFTTPQAGAEPRRVGWFDAVSVD
ncbi:hypothetical protein [Algihabitans albus]|uniref:hypothetical protein n=1 Tax=Algihabitans albus TaxID=2164067 RepID=UPI0013C2CBCE|nr:hypothetical protein [Algihabitans albus]